MKVERHEAERRLFLACRRLAPERRDSFLRRACGGDERLERSVRRLLRLESLAARTPEPEAQSPTPAAGGNGEAREAGGIEPGILLAHRYRILGPLDEGAIGTVHEAIDELTRTLVAVKVVPAPNSGDMVRLRREVAALRWLRLPGVVRLLDDGVEGDVGWIVMERVRGAPYPGVALPASWDAIRRPTVALLETLARIHWAGVIHGDLKPSNVLVGTDGLPVVLDLGLSTGPAIPRLGDSDGLIAGTPRYLAPGRLRHKPADVSSDLYAVGVMLFEALTGMIPHEDSDSLREFFAARQSRPAPAVLERAPTTPPHVARLVDRLLERDPEERPASARDALALLASSHEAATDPVSLPFLGSRLVVGALVEAARHGRSLDVCGPAGSGRSRTLSEAAAAIEREGRRIVRVGPGTTPFESLSNALADGEEPLPDGKARGAATARLSLRLASGDVFVADDAEGLDSASAAALESCRGLGTVWRAFRSLARDAIVVGPLPEQDLQALFAGHNRLHHVPEDAARALLVRTGGYPHRIAVEIAAWERAGLARRERDLWVIGRDAIERLLAGLSVVAHAPPSVERGAALDPDLEDLRVAIDLAGPHARVNVLAHALGRPERDVDGQLGALAHVGVVYRTPGGRISVVTPSDAGASWSAERRAALNAALAAAIDASAPERVYHLLAAGDRAAVPAAALAAAARLRLEGRPDCAMALATEGLRCAQEDPGSPVADGLHVEMLASAILAGTSGAVEQVLHRAERAPLSTATARAVETVARAALRVIEWDSQRAMDSLTAAGVLEPPALERSRLAVLALAARQIGTHVEERVVAEVVRRAANSSAGPRGLPLEDLVGWLRYDQGRFAEAGETHLRGAREAPSYATRANGLLNAASAFLEAHDLARAEALAGEALGITNCLRLATHEARAWRTLRAVAYRRGDALVPDEELVAACASIGNPNLEGMILLTEAAVAWRCGGAALGRDFATRAAERWERSGRALPRLLAQGLSALCGGPWRPVPPSQAIEIARAGEATPRAALQGLALAVKADPALLAAARPVFDALLAKVPPAEWSQRREVASVDECRACLDAASRGDGGAPSCS